MIKRHYDNEIHTLNKISHNNILYSFGNYIKYTNNKNNKIDMLYVNYI